MAAVHIALELVEAHAQALETFAAYSTYLRPLCQCAEPGSRCTRLLLRRFTLDVNFLIAQHLDIHTRFKFPRYVHELTMTGPFAEPEDVLPLLSHFDHVHRLSLNIWGPYHGLIHLPRTHLSRRLSLYCISFHSFQAFVIAFPHLEELIVHNVNYRTRGVRGIIDQISTH
ncbi:hypothetical protein BD779DRAFT_66243 [Infundibulicybe gibba]|nr:hypothetical protein BD779DRAFT_66243 [Infundibulicybe gibba]